MKRKKDMLLTMLAAALLMGGCAEEPNPDYTPAEPAAPVEIDRTAFARGADISWVTQLESEGNTFATADGVTMECTALMKTLGMNAIRLRVWVDPEGGWCSEGDVLVKARRAQALGMRLMIDFHYSDTWADPGKQVIPAAWLDLDAEGLKQAVADHTKEVLSLLKANGVEVEWVQVGNETTNGMLRHLSLNADGTAGEESTVGGGLRSNPANYAAFTTAGYDAVKEIYPDAKVIVHVDRGHDVSYARNVFNKLEANGGKYDIIGLSLYPGSDWESSTESCVGNITTLYNEFGHDVMICEVGMPWDDAAKAREMLTYLITNSRATGHCLGVFYWEPEAPAGYNGGYTLGAFDNGRPTEALDAFKE